MGKARKRAEGVLCECGLRVGMECDAVRAGAGWWSAKGHLHCLADSLEMKETRTMRRQMRK